jgi:hypothetical protein
VVLLAAAGCDQGGCRGREEVADTAIERGQPSMDAGDTGREVDAAGDPIPDLGEAPPIPPVTPHEREAPVTAQEWRYLTDLPHTEAVLSGANIAWGRSRSKIKTLSRIGDEARAIRFKLLLDPEQGDNIWAQYKVRQTGYYYEWKREILAYRVGKLVHAPVVVAVERPLPRRPFERFEDMTEEDFELVRWQGSGVRGSLRYWVEGLLPRHIGGRECDEQYMAEIAAALHPANREALLADEHTVYREMGRALVFDYLILNDDRARNLGTVIAPDGVRHLVLIDNGLAFGLETAGRVEARGLFEAMTLFPRDTVEALRELEREQVMAIVTPEDDRVLSIKTRAAEQMWERRNAILERVDELQTRYGDWAFYP